MAGGGPVAGGLPIRALPFAKFHYLGAIGVLIFFTTRCGWIDYKKYYRISSVKRLWKKKISNNIVIYSIKKKKNLI